MTDDQLALLEEKPLKVVWTAVYHRHFSKREEEFTSAKKAYEFLQYGSNSGYLFQDSIIKPDGTVLNVMPFGPNDDIWADYDVFEKRFLTE